MKSEDGEWVLKKMEKQTYRYINKTNGKKIFVSREVFGYMYFVDFSWNVISYKRFNSFLVADNYALEYIDSNGGLYEEWRRSE